MREIYVLNGSRDLDDTLAQRWISAIKLSLDVDYAPINDQSAILVLVGRGGVLPAGEWGGVLSDVPQSEYLGEHHVEALPRFVVSLATSKAEGVEPSTVIDHEIKEMLRDPTCSACEELEDGTLLAAEMCDPTEGASGTYTRDGVALENFVDYCGYFKSIGDRYDFQRVLKAPQGRDLPPGTYQLRRPPGGDWAQDLGADVRASKIIPGRYSRRGIRIAREIARAS